MVRCGRGVQEQTLESSRLDNWEEKDSTKTQRQLKRKKKAANGKECFKATARVNGKKIKTKRYEDLVLHSCNPRAGEPEAGGL